MDDDVGPPGPRGPQWQEAEVSRLVQSRIAGQVDEIRRLDPLVRYDAPDAVHAMRVALRRLSAALATFRPTLERTVTEPMREELRWLARTLGAARDAEVQRARLDDSLGDDHAAVRRRVDHRLREQYAQAHAVALVAMDSDRYRALLDSLDRLATEPPWTSTAGETARVVVPERLERDWTRLDRRMDLALRTDDPVHRATLLHDARRAAKRLRYALEPVVAAYDGGDGTQARRAQRTLMGIKDLQSVLGDLQDTVVTRQLLRELPSELGLDPDGSFLLGRLHGREESAAQHAMRSVDEAWQAARRSRPRRWLV